MTAQTAGPRLATARAVVQRSLRRLDRRAKVLMAALGVTSMLAGIAEANLLLIISNLGAHLVGLDLSLRLGRWHAAPTEAQMTAAGAVLLAVLAVLTALASTLAARITEHVIVSVRSQVTDAYLDADWATQSRTGGGAFLETLNNHAGGVEEASQVLADLLRSTVTLGIYLLFAVLTEPRASLVLLAAGLAVHGVTQPLAWRAKGSAQAAVESGFEYAVWANQLAAIGRELRVFGVREPARRQTSALLERSARDARHRATLLSMASGSFRIAGLGLVLCTVALADHVRMGSPAAVGAVGLLFVRALSIAQRVSSDLRALTTLSPRIDRLDASLASFAQAADPRGGAAAPEAASVSVVALTYGHEPDRPILHDVAFEVPAGRSVAIVGPSGAGKTTLLQVLVGLCRPWTGGVDIGGRPVLDLPEEVLSEFAAYVPQDNRLVRGTATENIAFLRTLGASQVERAAEAAGLSQEIASLPEGFRTRLGGEARSLSGGQLQRLGLARALAGNPRVLVLDEPTSALDPATEARLLAQLDSLRGRVTLIVAAHRLSTIERCDELIVLEDGRITGRGTPTDLRRNHPYVAEAFERADHAPIPASHQPSS